MPPGEQRIQGRTYPRQPAIPAAVGLAAGIAADRWLDLPLAAWGAITFAAAALWVVLFSLGRLRAAAVLLLLAVVGIGGGRHHQYWSVIPEHDVSRFAAERPKLVRVTGIVVARPVVRSMKEDRSRPAWAQVDSTAGVVECRILGEAGRRVDVSGRLRFSIAGHVMHVEAGDEVEIVGWLSRPRGPQNPGEFDFREYLRRQRIFCVLSADHPDAVRRMGESGKYQLQRWADQHRAEGDSFFVRSLSRETVPIASALFLGDRSHMSEELRVLFTESGLMHVLAISGVNVGILAVSLWFCCRLLQLSAGATSIAVLAIVVWYAFVTGGEPPVVRAAILVGLAALGRPWKRRVLAANVLAISAAGVLMWNPSDLFQIGAQLSFLAVAAIIWASGWAGMRRAARDPFDELTADDRTSRLISRLSDCVKQGYMLSFAVALFTVPLIAREFHLVSPIGVVINVLLMPLVTMILWLGYALLFCAYLIPEITPPAAWVFDVLMKMLLAAVRWAGESRFGHFYTPAPPLWWMAGYYAALAVLMAAGRRAGVKRYGWSVLLGWCVAGLGWGLVPARTEGLRATFLSVGHGCAVLMELPGGRTVLYDGGSLSNGRRAEQAILKSLWGRGYRGLDAIVVSHADIDHFNAVPGLMRTVPVGTLFLTQSALDFEQEAMRDLCETAHARDVPIRLIGAGDRLRLDAETTLAVLQPSPGSRNGNDNANSLVMLVEFAGRKVLLTGDLEKEGTERLLMLPAIDVDVMLSPHHGSPAANPSRLYAWATPESAVISGGHESEVSRIRASCNAGCELLSTAELGAISFVIAKDGSLTRDRPSTTAP